MGRVMTQDEAIVHVAEVKRNGRRVCFTDGSFELLHPTDIRRIEHTRSLGDLVVVGIWSDVAVGAQCGEGRPVVPQDERAEILCALEAVDVAVVIEPDTLAGWIARLSPTVFLTTGKSSALEKGVCEAVDAAGGRVVSMPELASDSTSAILARIRSIPAPDAPLAPGGANLT